MLQLLADENLDGNIVRGVLRSLPELDIVRAQEAGLSGVDDPAVLEWAAAHGRVVVTHDVATMTRFAYERVGAGLPMPGVIEIVSSAILGRAIEALGFRVVGRSPTDSAGRPFPLLHMRREPAPPAETTD